MGAHVFKVSKAVAAKSSLKKSMSLCNVATKTAFANVQSVESLYVRSPPRMFLTWLRVHGLRRAASATSRAIEIRGSGTNPACTTLAKTIDLMPDNARWKEWHVWDSATTERMSGRWE